MEKFRAITIGIEEYLHWQPLKGAENNAQALYRYFFQEAQIPAYQLLLLTDTSPSPGKRSTYPTRDNILQWINDSPLTVQHYWFFFQGYGVNYQGEDYLLPIDSSPQTLPQTGIKMRSLLEKLQGCSQQLLVILDLQNPFKDGKLGQTTLEIAQKREINLIFSCRSHVYQTLSAEKGIFVTAFIEALRYYGQQLTLAKLDAYLQERLTPLHRANFPAIALPIIMSPNGVASRQPLLPPLETRPKTPSIPFPLPQQPLGQTMVEQPLSLPNLPKSPSPPTEFPLKLSSQPISLPPKPTQSADQQPLAPQSSPPSSAAYLKWLWWGGGILLLVGLCWLIRGKIQQSVNEVNPEKQLTLDYGKTSLGTQQASRFNEAIKLARQIQPHTGLYQEAQQQITRWSQVILDIAQGRAMQGDFPGAIAAAKLVPTDNKKLYQMAQQSIEQWEELSQQQTDNQVLIDAALALIKPDQASSYHRAITTLRYLKPEEPGYQTAQRLIEQLSDKIYQLAQTRATQGQLTLAVKTAQLVPSDSRVYPKTQRAIIEWQQQLRLR